MRERRRDLVCRRGQERVGMRRNRRGFVSRESRRDLVEVRDRRGQGLSWDQNRPSVKLWTRQDLLRGNKKAPH